VGCGLSFVEAKPHANGLDKEWVCSPFHPRVVLNPLRATVEYYRLFRHVFCMGYRFTVHP
ncbi:hypothetical protein KCA24_21735, partial [Escherichia coli]|nr:hypothetical protein [Escherichia coli]